MSLTKSCNKLPSSRQNVHQDEMSVDIQPSSGRNVHQDNLFRDEMSSGRNVHQDETSASRNNSQQCIVAHLHFVQIHIDVIFHISSLHQRRYFHSFLCIKMPLKKPTFEEVRKFRGANRVLFLKGKKEFFAVAKMSQDLCWVGQGAGLL